MALLEPPPQITVFNWVWIKWLSTLRDKLCAPEVVTVEDSDMSNGWVNFDSDRKANYWRGADGVVHLSGIITGGAINTPSFTLPYQPSLVTGTIHFPTVANNAFGVCAISSTGILTPTIGSTTWVSLNGVTYKS